MRSADLLRPLAVLGTLCLPLSHAVAQCQVLETDAESLGVPVGEDLMGRAVALSGDVVFTGVPFRDTIEGDDTGFVVVQRWNGLQWVVDPYIKAPVPTAGAWFGEGLDAHGDRLVVGAVGPSPSGNAFVYARSGNQWVFEQELVPTTPPAYWFGNVLSMHGDRVAVGLYASAQVVLFRRVAGTWVEEQVLQGPLGIAYGVAVDLRGDQLVVGASSADAHAGGAFVYRHDGESWVAEGDMLTASDGEYNDRFGGAVAIEGDTLFVGAPSNRGAVYRFVRDAGQWSEQEILFEGLLGKELYGRQVELDGDLLAVASYGGEDGPSQGGSGTVYIYRRELGVWSLDRYAKAATPGFHEAMGESLAVEGLRVVAGASGKDVGAITNAGGSYTFTVSGALDVGAGLAGFAGQAPRLELSGPLCGDDVALLTLAQARPAAPAGLVVGLDTAYLAFKGGTLVPLPDVLVTGLATDALGALGFALTWPAGFPGLTSHWQVIVADADGPAGFALSNALAVTSGGL